MLISKVAEKIGNRYFSNSERLPLDVCIYGLELMISSFIGTALVLIISIIVGDIWLGIIYNVALSCIRIFSGGYHAKTYFRCGSVMVITFLFSVAVYKYIIYSLQSVVNVMMIISFIITLVVLLIMAPIENENKIINNKQTCKFVSIFMAIAETLAACMLYNHLGFVPVIIIVPTQAVIVASIIFEYIIQKVKIKKERSRTNEKLNKLIKESY